MAKKNLILIFLAWLAVWPLPVRGDVPAASSPQDLSVRVWSKAQGLPDNSVTAVLQTRDGYLWLGTAAGLARFDGARFVAFTPTEEKTNAPLRVTALCEDSGARLWIGTQGNGFFYFSNGVLGRFHTQTNFPDDTVNSIAEDAAGSLWLGTPSGLVRLEKDGLTRFTSKDGLPNDFVSSVHVARSGTVWVTTRGGMCQFKDGKIVAFPFQTDSPGRSPESLGVYEDRAGKLWAFGDTYLVSLTDGKHLNHFGGGDNLSALRIWSLCEGRNGELWIGTSGKGLYCFANDNFSPVSLRNGGLASDVRALCEDREGNLWLGTDGGGLVRLQPRNVRMLDASAGLPGRAITCLAVNSQGRAWVGSERGGIFSGAEHFEPLSGEAANALQNFVSSIAQAPDESLWIATPGAGIFCAANGHLARFDTANGLSDNQIFSIAVAADGDVWAGTASGTLDQIHGGEIKNFGVEAGLPPRPITAILIATNGALWLGNADGTVLHGENGRFNTVIESSVLGGKAVRALHEDAVGRIWIGTADGHLAFIATGTYLTWEINLGGTGEPILGIVSGDYGDLWIGTARAIYHLATAEIQAALAGQMPMRPQLIFEMDATPTSATAYGWPLAAKSVDGKLWFGLADQIVTLDPRRLSHGSSALPVLLEDIVVNERQSVRAVAKSKSEPDGVRLPSDLRSLDIHFTALNFSEPEKIRFRYRLDGYDQNWVESGESRAVHYGKLNFGNYNFRVQAGAAGAWDANETMFAFFVPTPLWRANWAIALYVFSAVTFVAVVVRLVSNRRLRQRLAALAQQQAMERERMRIAKDMHDEIGSKLTKISFMSERAKGELHGQDSVAKKLNSIAGTSRDLLQSLDEIVWAVNPHNDTLEHLAAYLGHYATEYLQNTSVECELHIPQNLPHHPLSAEARHNLFLAFEEALNNALKHGQATHICVDMEATAAHFEIRVQDNGCGFDVNTVMSAQSAPVAADKRVGIGMNNLQQRLADVGGTCHVNSRPNAGTTVTFRLPLAGTKRI